MVLEMPASLACAVEEGDESEPGQVFQLLGVEALSGDRRGTGNIYATPF